MMAAGLHRRSSKSATQGAAQILLEHLSHRVSGYRLDDLELFGAFLHREALEAAVLADLGQADIATVPQHHEGDDSLSRALVRNADHRRIGDGGIPVEQVLHLDHGDVLGVPDDDVLDAARDADISRRVDGAEVAGMEPPIGID